MKLLITGGAGFIGSNFIHYMLETHPGYNLINIDNLTYAGNPENLINIEGNPNYTFIKGDICDKQLFAHLDFEAIVNFAAESHVDRSILDSQPFLQTNILGTHNLLEVARKRDCLLLQVSTDEVYGSIAEGQFTESSPLQPNSPYAASKAAADMLVRAYHKTYHTKVMTTRCSNNYGPYQFPEKLIPLVIQNALNKKPIPVYGDGKNVRDWIFVLDHCKAIERVLHEGIIGGVYNVGTRNEKINIDLVRVIIKLVAQEISEDQETLLRLITFVNDRPGHDRRYAIDATKIEKELGWQAETSFEEGLRKTIKWYLSNHGWLERVITGEYLKYYQDQYEERLRK